MKVVALLATLVALLAFDATVAPPFVRVALGIVAFVVWGVLVFAYALHAELGGRQ